MKPLLDLVERESFVEWCRTHFWDDFALLHLWEVPYKPLTEAAYYAFAKDITKYL